MMRSRAEQGFTILEILLAVSILAVVSFTVGKSLQSTMLNCEAAREQKGLHRQVRIAWQRLNEDLTAAIVYPDIAFVGEQKQLQGEYADDLKFVSLSHLDFNPEGEGGGMAVIHYWLEADSEDSEQLRLIRSDRKLFPETELEEEDEAGFVLCDHLKSFSLTYVDSEGNEVESWDSSQIESDGSEEEKRVMPAAVRMKFVFWTENENGLPVIFQSSVRLMIDGEDEGDNES